MSKTRNKYTIGFLFDYLYEDYTNQIFNNVLKSCREHDLNFIGFGGGTLKATAYKYRDQKNVIFDLVSGQTVDAIIALTGVFGNFVSINQVKKLLAKYSGIPLVSIGLDLGAMENVTNVVVDNNIGMEALLTHLIEFHNCRQIAFIKGASNNYDALQRFEVYKRVLKRYNIPIRNDLIVSGNFDYFYGIEAVRILLDERKLSFDALASANDAMAIYAMYELQKRGFRVPEDIIITGFDDISMCLAVEPRLTTVKQSFFDIGRVSVETVLSMLKGIPTQQRIVLPSKFIIRESCGCSELETLDDIMSSHLIDKAQRNIHLLTKSATYNYNRLYDVMKHKLPDLVYKVDITPYLAQFFSMFSNGKTIHKNKLLLFFKKLFLHLFEREIEIDDMYKLTLLFFNELKRDKAELITSVWKEVLILVGILNHHYLSAQRVNLREEEEVVFRINEEFINTFNLPQLKKTIKLQLPKLPIKSLYLCLYKDKSRARSKILLHYCLRKNSDQIKRGVFPSHSLIPHTLKSKSKIEYVVMALYFQREHLGYILFEVGTINGSIYETLATQISSAIKGAQLTNEVKEYTSQLEDKVRARTRELEELNIKLKQLDSIKNDFIANITHDFRSPLTAILNVSDLALKQKSGSEERVREDFEIIYDASLRLKRTIDRLLDLAKMDAQGITLRVAEVDVVSLLESIIDFYSSSVIGSGIKIVRDLPDYTIDNFYTDTEKFEEVINNIMSNAVKFVDPENGLITIKLQDYEDRIRISVSDNGIGIARDKLKVIFNRFEQVHKEKNSYSSGSGIGLSFAKQLVVYMKGEIWAESEGEGKGARFIVELRKGKDIFSKSDLDNKKVASRKYTDEKVLIQAELEKKLAKQEIFAYLEDLNRENEFNYKKGKILIIEDDKNIRKVIIRYLLRDSYKNFIQAADGKQGLEALYEYTPDLVICDYNMPYMKGDEFHDKMLTNPTFKHIPCIFLSAIADDKIILERRQKGASAYLKKPIDENDFLLTVEQQLKKYFEYLKTVRLVTIDELTGLYNKRALYKNLAHELFIRRYRDITLIFVDLDHFKIINDSYGHLAGDKLLSGLGRLLKSNLRNYDIPARYGGEEFIVILPETNLKNGLKVAEGLREKIKNKRIGYEGNSLKVTASFGVVSLRDHADHISNKLKIADIKTLFEVKQLKQADWKKIESYKLKIVDILIDMADKSMYKAKQTICNKCGFAVDKFELFKNQKCPKCESGDLTIGRNRVVAFA